MSAPPMKPWTREDYDRDAREYYLSLTLEDFMEPTPQGTQREITLISLNEMKARRGGIGYFNELLVQSRKGGKIERVVPDNMVVLGNPGEHERKSYALELEACPIFWVMEYVSDEDPEKDYARNFEKYEGIFQVDYYLIFDPEQQSLLLYHLREGRYTPVEADTRGRYPIPQLEVEVGLLDGWVRFWFRGELLPVPAELRQHMKQLRDEMVKLHAANLLLQKNNSELKAANTRLQTEKSDLENQNDGLLAVLRSVVETRARLAGRQDILTQLGTCRDAQQLQAWLAELGT